jgi:hypothetical protein
MGKRGPRPGTKYRRRIVVAPRIPIETDRQLVQAQSFNERLDQLMGELERRETYPVNVLEKEIIEQVVEAAALLQEAIIEGIESYSLRRSPSRKAIAANQEQAFLPGAFELGCPQSRARNSNAPPS